MNTLLTIVLLASTWYASPSGSGSTCSSGSPCTLATAHGKTVAGDVVQLAAGTHTDLTITRSGSAGNVIKYVGYDLAGGGSCPTTNNSSPNPIPTRPNPSANVQLVVQASHIQIECIRRDGARPVKTNGSGLDDITWYDLYNDNSGNPGVSGSGVFSIEGCDSSDSSCFPTNVTGSRGYTYAPSIGMYLRCMTCTFSDIEIERPINAGDGDGVQFFGDTISFIRFYIHGSVYTDATSAHTDGFQSWNIGGSGEIGKNITITRSTILNTDECWLVRNTSDATKASHQNYTITNNVCAHPRLSGGTSGNGELEAVGGYIRIFHNLFNDRSIGCDNGLASGVTCDLKNNIELSTSLSIDNGATVNQSGNVTSCASCFVDSANDNYHLVVGATSVINQGTTGLGVTVDHDNLTRDATPDIGPFEYGAGNSGNPPRQRLVCRSCRVQ